ncbi:MAG TPA: cytochrome P450 [Cyclobacteriaceae bacterium]
MNVSELWRPAATDFVKDPFPYYERLRAIAPIHRLNTGDYLVLSHEGVKTVLSDRNFITGVRLDWVNKVNSYFLRQGKNYGPMKRIIDSMLLQINPPTHTALKNLLVKNWMSAEDIQINVKTVVYELIADMKGNFDYVQRFARKLPQLVVCEMLGLHDLDNHDLYDTIIVLRMLDPFLTLKDLDDINCASERLYKKLELFYNSVDPNDTTLSAAIKQYAVNNQSFDPVSFIVFVLITGLETTSSMLSMALVVLLQDKEIASRLFEDRSLIVNYIHEILRLYAPVQITGRTNLKATTMHEVAIPPNSVVTICIGAANRDPEKFEKPVKLDLNRNSREQLTFGHGIHHCIGYRMALIEGVEFINEILPLVGKMKILAEPEWDWRLSLRNINSLKIHMDER